MDYIPLTTTIRNTPNVNGFSIYGDGRSLVLRAEVHGTFELSAKRDESCFCAYLKVIKSGS